MVGLAPGSYQLMVRGWPALRWIPESVQLAGRDVSDAAIDVSADITDVVVTFTDRPGALAGTVRRSTGGPDTTALVVGFPANQQTPNGLDLHIFTQRVMADGTYTVPALAPGDYNVVAVPDELENTWYDPAILQRLIPLAVRMHVAEGTRLTQDLVTSVVR